MIFGQISRGYEFSRNVSKIPLSPRVFDKLTIDRRETFDLITHLTPLELHRVGIHNRRGRLNIVEWTELFVLHEAHHIRTIFELAHPPESKEECTLQLSPHSIEGKEDLHSTE